VEEDVEDHQKEEEVVVCSQEVAEEKRKVAEGQRLTF
jgi:hypothetical protein